MRNVIDDIYKQHKYVDAYGAWDSWSLDRTHPSAVQLTTYWRYCPSCMCCQALGFLWLIC